MMPNEETKLLAERIVKAVQDEPTESDWRKLFEPEIRPCPTCKRGGRMPLVFSLDHLARAKPAIFAARAEDGKTPSRTRECPTCVEEDFEVQFLHLEAILKGGPGGDPAGLVQGTGRRSLRALPVLEEVHADPAGGHERAEAVSGAGS